MFDSIGLSDYSEVHPLYDSQFKPQRLRVEAALTTRLNRDRPNLQAYHPVQPNSAISGPRGMPHSMHRILHTLDSRLSSLHYDISIRQQLVKDREPVLRKFDRLHDEKVKFGQSRVKTQRV